jgi:putative metalloprotease
MNIKYAAIAVLAAAGLAGCSSSGLNMDGLTSAGGKVFQAYNMTDAQIQQLSDQACAQSDAENTIAKPGSKYDARLQKIAKPLSKSLNGVTPNFKVYQTKDINAWAMANGCIRVYSGLMDKMNDNELQGIIGHEMGHVALGHTKKAMQTAYTVSAARDAASAAGGATVAALSASQLGDLTEKFINAQFSQSQELDADSFAYDTMKANNLKTTGLVTAFNKLAAMESGNSSAAESMMSSHPDSKDRMQRIQARIDADKK